MNAGAYGGELREVIRSVRFLDDGLELKTISGDDAAFGYRDSIFRHKKGWIVTGADIGLEKGQQPEIEEKMRELARRRRDKQPLEYPSAGSTFKRPGDGIYAAKLIEDCGLKGFSVGGAKVSEKHAGFVINTGNACSSDILRLMEEVRRTVFDRTGIELEPEVELMAARVV